MDTSSEAAGPKNGAFDTAASDEAVHSEDEDMWGKAVDGRDSYWQECFEQGLHAECVDEDAPSRPSPPKLWSPE
eukprot:4338562-Pleurochrysis_carterae.AAC.1